ncbi:hypothetical protein ACRALDRAFT_2104908, partial [Sodiomyces alcalophilus JCM 7366]|uniref:uncharacterized protein n=1 Tax=Sodiomyces alcalophilus JCM 7366 TaxID=591952 RepID=UPI0039B4B91D
SRRRSRRENQPLDQHINKPLRRHVWTSTDRTWTRAAIDRERADFFDTRVTARPEAWQAIHAALQVLWDPVGQGAADDGTNGLATAESILHAADITLPTGNLAQGVYDILGNYYPLPEWVVADPENLAENDAEGEARDRRTSHEGVDDEDMKGDWTGADDDDSDDLDEHEAAKRREEKGKAVVQVQDLIPVRARLSENARDITVSIVKTDPVRTLAWRVQEAASLSSSKKVRIAYMGKILKENLPLDAQGWREGHTVNALVFDR